jgi:hypothetical protein
VADVSVYYFVRRSVTDGKESLSKRRATLEAIKDQGEAVMQSQRVVDHTELDGNGFLIGGGGDESQPVDALWAIIRSLESRARSREDGALKIAGGADNDRKTVLLRESREFRNEAQALRERIGRLSAPPEPYAAPRFSPRT